jgi:hypothetical protein
MLGIHEFTEVTDRAARDEAHIHEITGVAPQACAGSDSG